MENQQVDSVPKAVKRPLDLNNNEEPNPKKAKVDERPLELMDVNYDCLLSIFKHLDMEDLVNVAEAHEQFVPAARTTFSRRFRHKEYVLSSFLTGQNNCISIEKDIAAPLIRHFGEYVSNLLVDCLSQHNDEVEDLIAKQCAGSLVNLGLTFTTTHCFKAIDTPFEKVEKLSVVRGMLSPKMSRLNVWCPNVTSLELFNVKLLDPTALEVNFQQLKELKMHNEIITIPKAAVIAMLRSNPQLEMLRLKRYEYDVDMIQSVSELLPALKEFEIWSPQDRFFSFGEQKIHFDAVKKFTVKSFYHRAEFLECIPFEFKELEELTLDGFNEYEDHIMNFVLENNGLTKLSLTPFVGDFDDLTYDDLLNIVRSLPKLTELEFCADLFGKDELIAFLTDHKMLEKVRLLFCDLPFFPEFRRELENNWKISIYSVEYACMPECDTHYCLALERK